MSIPVRCGCNQLVKFWCRNNTATYLSSKTRSLPLNGD